MKITLEAVILLMTWWMVTMATGQKSIVKRVVQHTSPSSSTHGYEVTEADEFEPVTRSSSSEIQKHNNNARHAVKSVVRFPESQNTFRSRIGYFSSGSARDLRVNYGGSKSGYKGNIKGVYTGSLSDYEEEGFKDDGRLKNEEVDDESSELQKPEIVLPLRYAHRPSNARVRQKSEYGINIPFMSIDNHRDKDSGGKERTQKRENPDIKSIEELKELYRSKLEELNRGPVLYKPKGIVFPGSEGNGNPRKIQRWSYDKNLRRPRVTESERSSKIRFVTSPASEGRQIRGLVESKDNKPIITDITSDVYAEEDVVQQVGIYTGPILGKSLSGYVPTFLRAREKVGPGINNSPNPQTQSSVVILNVNKHYSDEETNKNEKLGPISSAVNFPSKTDSVIGVPISINVPIPYNVNPRTGIPVAVPLIVRVPISHPLPKNSKPS